IRGEKLKLQKLKILSICLILSTISFAGVSEDYDIELSILEKQYEEKLDNDYSTIGMLRAMEEYYSELDKVLNKSYKELMAILSDEDKIALRDSQRAWIKFRDEQIEFSAKLYSKKEGTLHARQPKKKFSFLCGII
ncbi:MAG: lysozyme inhibitor LprI family protein, partial [Fusobacteriaceae bacterium]